MPRRPCRAARWRPSGHNEPMARVKDVVAALRTAEARLLALGRSVAHAWGRLLLASLRAGRRPPAEPTDSPPSDLGG